ncbi:MAG TPA: FkbM family methyltransferase, partial [Caulobacter sp.]|nr:FkbM family methyltransferase [Caulobacter sp.]
MMTMTPSSKRLALGLVAGVALTAIGLGLAQARQTPAAPAATCVQAGRLLADPASGKIETERTDDFFERLGVKPDFLKVDTEGTEQDVIEGSERLLTSCVLGVRASCNF